MDGFFAHIDTPGIPPEKAEQIRARLDRIETEHQVRVLFACESGSRGWGFESPDSDYDVRFVYVHPPSWYLRLTPGRDVIECPAEEEIDLCGWDVQKAFRLLLAGNAQMVEWLDSPIVYRADPGFLDRLRGLLPRIHRPERTFYHYVHMAGRNHRQYVQGRDLVRLKKYLYVLRPLLAARWIAAEHGPAPMRFQALVDAMVADPSLRQAIEALLVRKRAGLERDLEPAIPEISTYLETSFRELEDLAMSKASAPDPAPLDALFLDLVTAWGTPAAPGADTGRNMLSGPFDAADFGAK